MAQHVKILGILHIVFGAMGVFAAIVVLLIFAAILIPVSFGIFAWALRRTKTTGTLTHI